MGDTARPHEHEALVRRDGDDAEEDADREARLELAHDDGTAHGDRHADNRRPDRRKPERRRAVVAMLVREDARRDHRRRDQDNAQEPRIRNILLRVLLERETHHVVDKVVDRLHVTK